MRCLPHLNSPRAFPQTLHPWLCFHFSFCFLSCWCHIVNTSYPMANLKTVFLCESSVTQKSACTPLCDQIFTAKCMWAENNPLSECHHTGTQTRGNTLAAFPSPCLYAQGERKRQNSEKKKNHICKKVDLQRQCAKWKRKCQICCDTANKLTRRLFILMCSIKHGQN